MTATLDRAPARPRATLERLVWRALGVPLLGKLAGANLVIVLAALAGVAAERQFNASGNVVPILGVALGLSLVVNLALVYVALRPLTDLEEAAARVSAGDLEARVAPSALADRDMARVGTTLNALLDRLTEDRARVRRLAAQVISAQDEERARVARELHDSTAQILTAVMLQLGAAAREADSAPLTARIATLRELAAEALEEVRTLSHTMHPRILDDLGFVAALEWLARQTRGQTASEVVVRAEAAAAPIPGPLASVLYRVAQEALRNAVRHADARRVELSVRHEPGQVVLEVADDGAGFDVTRAEERRPGMGLFSMRERVALVNGRLARDERAGPGHARRGDGSTHDLRSVAAMSNIRVVLVDDHTIVRTGLKAVLGAAPEIEVVGEASSGREATALLAGLTADVVVMDVSMADGDGIAATRAITRDRHDPPRVLVLTMHAEEAYLEAVLEAGATGYLTKSTADRELVEAVRTVARGQRYVQPAAERVLAQGAQRREEHASDRARFGRLTDREREVMQLIAEGYTAPEIGEQLSISPKTVDTYKQRINDKLGLTHRADYVRLALKLGLLQTPP